MSRYRLLPTPAQEAVLLDQMIPTGPAGRVVEQFGDPPAALLIDQKRHRPVAARDLGSHMPASIVTSQ